MNIEKGWQEENHLTWLAQPKVEGVAILAIWYSLTTKPISLDACWCIALSCPDKMSTSMNCITVAPCGREIINSQRR